MNKEVSNLLNESIGLIEASAASHRITIDVTGQFAKEVYPMLEYIKQLAAPGHSFPVVVDPDDSENKKTFPVDGDGNSHIVSIGIKELPKNE